MLCGRFLAAAQTVACCCLDMGCPAASQAGMDAQMLPKYCQIAAHMLLMTVMSLAKKSLRADLLGSLKLAGKTVFRLKLVFEKPFQGF